MTFMLCAGDHDLEEIMPDIWRCRNCSEMEARGQLRPLSELLSGEDIPGVSAMAFADGSPYKSPDPLSWEQKYKDLQKSLSSLLSPEQLEAAEISGISPELYCLEWLKGIVTFPGQDNA